MSAIKRAHGIWLPLSIIFGEWNWRTLSWWMKVFDLYMRPCIYNRYMQYIVHVKTLIKKKKRKEKKSVFWVYLILTGSWWMEGLDFFFTIDYYIPCQVESGRSVVKVELWNMIRLCRNLQLQIVWNWLEVLVLFGRHSAIGSIYLLKTTKVSGNTERGSQMVIFLLYTFFFLCVLDSLFGKSQCLRESYLERFEGFPCFYF